MYFFENTPSRGMACGGLHIGSMARPQQQVGLTEQSASTRFSASVYTSASVTVVGQPTSIDNGRALRAKGEGATLARRRKLAASLQRINAFAGHA